MPLKPEQLAEGERRLVYFFVYGREQGRRAVICPTCAEGIPATATQAVYTASRLYRCGSCHIWIGPANAEEQEEA
jgi:hypothetical protein